LYLGKHEIGLIHASEFALWITLRYVGRHANDRALRVRHPAHGSRLEPTKRAVPDTKKMLDEASMTEQHAHSPSCGPGLL
jgi:hypothetical protein